jgi:hypothetical protein
MGSGFESLAPHAHGLTSPGPATNRRAGAWQHQAHGRQPREESTIPSAVRGFLPSATSFVTHITEDKARATGEFR